LRIAAVEAEISMNQALKEAVDLWLNEQKKKARKEGKK
jgi:hypothetical protein